MGVFGFSPVRTRWASAEWMKIGAPTCVSQALGKADVVAVAVREDETSDVREGSSDGIQFVEQVVPMAR